MLSEIVLGLLDSAERLCLSAVRLVFATDGLCVRAVRGLVFTPVRSVLERLLPLPPVSAPQPFAVAEGAMAPPEAAPPSSVPLAGFLVASSMSPVRSDSTRPRPNPDLSLAATLTLPPAATLTLIPTLPPITSPDPNSQPDPDPSPNPNQD